MDPLLYAHSVGVSDFFHERLKHLIPQPFFAQSPTGTFIPPFLVQVNLRLLLMFQASAGLCISSGQAGGLDADHLISAVTSASPVGMKLSAQGSSKIASKSGNSKLAESLAEQVACR